VEEIIMPNEPQSNSTPKPLATFKPATETKDDGFDFDGYGKELEQEFKVSKKFDLAEQAKNYLDEKAMPALRTIGYLMEHASNERIRLDAAKYIAEHSVLGVEGKQNSTESTLARLMNIDA
jgi:hypothetical protein